MEQSIAIGQYRTMTNMRDRALPCLLVLLLAGWNLFHGLGDIRQPIWDENYYLTSTARFELGRTQFASHPPLGLMLIAGGDRLSGLNRTIDWRPIAAVKSISGAEMPAAFDYRGVRWASALFGTLAAGLFFWLMLALGRDRWFALNLSALFVFDGAILTQLRAAHLDGFQLFFIIGALLAFVACVRGRSGWLDVALGFAIGAATMIRANGVLLMVLPVVSAAARSLIGERSARVRGAFAGLVFAAGGFALAVLLTAVAYLSVSRTAPDVTTRAGIIDARAMSDTSLRQVADLGRPTLDGTVSLARDYRRYMTNDLTGIGSSDPNGSSPLLWPLGRKPINYRWDSDGTSTAYLVLAPNVVGWLISLAGVIAGGFALLRGGRSSTRVITEEDAVLLAGFVGTWLALLIADVILASTRVMYLYHFLPNLIIGFATVSLVAAKLPARSRDKAAAIILPLLLGMFLFTAPLIFHTHISAKACRLRQVVGISPICH